MVEFIDEIPKVLQYFVSGFIFLKIFFFLDTKKDYDASFFTIWSVVISFIITGIVKIFDTVIYPQCQLLLWSEVIICACIAVVLSFATYKLINSSWFSSFLDKATQKSIHDNLWRDVIDYKLGTVLKIFMKNNPVIYMGKLAAHEENGNDSWFLLTEYICIYPETDKEYNSADSSNPTRVMIPLSEVERIELYYDENTKIFN